MKRIDTLTWIVAVLLASGGAARACGSGRVYGRARVGGGACVRACVRVCARVRGFACAGEEEGVEGGVCARVRGRGVCARA